ncbi:Linker histone H1/H5 domain H15 [Arabidopsis suecica]|uniref:MYB transcription factor n=1 Tax=Arabidopsis suecica TaxID=45249 RepID=A0A8T2CM73_ARASU|nr:Linker histone H1/H5 domain H15 [Arabidopsis suecica]
MLGHRKNKWTVEEEEALLAGIAKHGSGKWSNIVDDPEFAAKLLDRTNINLKDKWRNMKKSRTHTLESTSIFTSPSKTSRAVVSNEPFLSSSSDVSNDTRYDAMVFEAISTINDENGSNLKQMLSFIEEQHEVPQNFKRLLSYSLRILVSQDKLKKVRNRYKISVTKEMKPTLTLCPKDSTKPSELPSTSVILTTSKETQEIDAAANRVAERINEWAKENDDWYEERQDFRMFLSECLTILVSQGKLKKVLDGYKISELENKVMEVAPEVVAMKLAESDNKRLIAAEAVEEEEQMHKLLEESHTMLQLCLEIHQQCNLKKPINS